MCLLFTYIQGDPNIRLSFLYGKDLPTQKKQDNLIRTPEKIKLAQIGQNNKNLTNPFKLFKLFISNLLNLLNWHILSSNYANYAKMRFSGTLDLLRMVLPILYLHNMRYRIDPISQKSRLLDHNLKITILHN